jgi:hypothetical protein
MDVVFQSQWIKYSIRGISILRKKRHRGDDVSDARKALAYIAAKEYRAPLHAVAEYLGVGRTAASALSRQGRDSVKRKEFVI